MALLLARVCNDQQWLQQPEIYVAKSKAAKMAQQSEFTSDSPTYYYSIPSQLICRDQTGTGAVWHHPSSKIVYDLIRLSLPQLHTVLGPRICGDAANNIQQVEALHTSTHLHRHCA